MAGSEGSAKLQTLMASGDLGDIIVMGDDNQDYRTRTLWKEMVEKSKGLGYDDVLAFWQPFLGSPSWAARTKKEIFALRKLLEK